MKLLLIVTLFSLLFVSNLFSLPIPTKINSSSIENTKEISEKNNSESITEEILNPVKEKESIQMITSSGISSNPSISTGIYNPNQTLPSYINRKPTEYIGEYIIPEPVTIILLGLGIAGLAFRRKF